jgi:general secretion pathway protein A
LIRQLNEYLVSALAQEGNLAILIDEAQNLNLDVMEELRMLSNLETSSSKLIQIVFVGQPELESKLNSKELRQLKQRIAIRSQIRPLTVDESREYMDHRLHLVGSSLKEIFNPDAVALIGRHAEGIPRTINVLCDNALLIGFRHRDKKIPAGTVREVLSDRGMVFEDGGEKKLSLETSQFRLSIDRIKKLSPKFVYFGLSAALVLILIFLARMGQLNFLGDKMTRGLPNTEAVATLNGPSPIEPPKKEILNPSIQPVSLDEKKEAPSADPNKELPPPKAPIVEKKTAVRSISVEKGETLYSVSRRSYDRANATLLDYILELNPEIADPNLVKPNDRIRLPILVEESLIRQAANGSFRIHLATFAKREYAERYKGEVILKGKTIQIEDRRISSQEVWYRVFAGEYQSREESQKTIKVLRGKGVLPLFAAAP